MSHWSTLYILQISMVSPPVTVLSRQPGWVTPPSQNSPGLLTSTGIKSKSLPQPTRSMWCGLFSQFNLTSCCSPLTHSPASHPAFLYSLFKRASLNIPQAHSLNPPGFPLKCHLLTHLEQLPHSHHPATPLQPLILLYFPLGRDNAKRHDVLTHSLTAHLHALERKLPEVSSFASLLLQRTSLMSWLWHTLF